MTRSQIADKIERQLSGDRDTVFLKAAEWATILEALRAPTQAVASPREYIVPASASHGPR